MIMVAIDDSSHMISSLLSTFGIVLSSQRLQNYWPQSEAGNHSTDWHCEIEHAVVNLCKQVSVTITTVTIATVTIVTVTIAISHWYIVLCILSKVHNREVNI